MSYRWNKWTESCRPYLGLDCKRLLHFFNLLNRFSNLLQAHVQVHLLLLELVSLLAVQLDEVVDEVQVMPVYWGTRSTLQQDVQKIT